MEGSSGLGFSVGFPGGSIFGEYVESYPSSYRDGVVEEIRRLLLEKRVNVDGEEVWGWELDDVSRRRILARLYEFERCGDVVHVRECDCCGEGRDGSGSFAGTKRTCQMHSCPTCGWVRAKKVSEFYERLSEDMEKKGFPPGYEWQFLTVTTRYRPDLESDLTWQALRKRALLVQKAVKKLWDKKLNVEGAGLFRSIECSAQGHVHAHMLYFGPPADEKELTDMVQKLCGDGLGYIHKRPIEGGDGEGNRLPDQVAKASRYMAKGTSGYGSEFDEGHYGYHGDTTTMMDPRLAARWEIATSVRRTMLTQKYGVFRGVKYDEADYSYEAPDDSQTPCEHCGTVGKWRDSYRRAEIWMQECHARGNKAMASGSIWVPWWKKAKNKQFLDGW